MLLNEPYILEARHAFLDAQAELGGRSVAKTFTFLPTLAWHGTSVSDERGFFMFYNQNTTNTDLIDLVGEHVHLTWNHHSVLVYCVGAALIPFDLSVSRRTFQELDLLSVESITPLVEVLQ